MQPKISQAKKQAFSEFNTLILNNLFEKTDANKRAGSGADKFHPETLKAVEKKRILLISPTGWQKVSVNLGLALLAGALKSIGFDVLVLDLCFDPLSDEQLEKIAVEFNPFIIGVSAKTAQAKEALRIAKILKEQTPEATFVAGGPHVTLAPDFFYTSPKSVFDFCIMSEAEISFTSLAVALAIGDKDLPYVLDGIVYQNKDTGMVSVNQWSPPANISLLPYPDFDAINNFKLENFCYPIVSSRGCPYSCIYCCVNLLTGSKKWRSRTPENIVQELVDAHSTYGISQFEFWDDNFTLDMKRAKKFCRLLMATGISFSWWCHNGIRADKIDQELADLMYAAGCTSVAFGIESGTPEVFESIQKGEQLSDCVNAVQTLKKAGIKAVGYFIIGLPADTLDSFVETVRFQRSLGLDHYTFGLLVPYPGTKVWDIVEAEGKFLQDVTDSQHFSSELPAISFQLDNFPPHDIIVAYYLTKFFELFAAAENILNQKTKCHITLLIDKEDGVTCATGLFYSLYRLKDKIKFSLFTDVPEISFRDDKTFSHIAQSFDHALLEKENELFAPSSETDLIVTSKSLSCLTEKNTSAEKFCLQISNPIEALVSISNVN